MMATAGPPSNSSFLPLLESLEDGAAGPSEQTDAYLTIANRLSGEEGRQFLPAVEQHFSRLGKVTLAHITSPHVELSQAALQSLGFCVFYSRVVSGIPETFVSEILSSLCSLVVKSTDKNTCTRALWVISKQSFPQDIVAKKVLSILDTLESVWNRGDIQSVVMEHEALNVIIRLLEQVPAQMGDAAVRWAKLVIPLVVHSASKVRLRAAAAMELGMPLLLEKQTDVAAIIEPMMSSKLIPELQKLFVSKNETNVLKLWPLFVKLLGKLLHRGGPFINSLLHLEELGFRSSSPTIKKIAFIAWKSLIDNFALNPDILCSGKRMKLLMQPLTSIHVRTETLLLTKVEVWWYLVVKLGPNLSSNFDLVSVPLLQCTIGSDSSSVSGTPSRAISQNGTVTPGTPGFNCTASTSRMSLNSSVQMPVSFPSIQLLGLEMLLHYFQGPDIVTTAAKNKLILSLEPLNHMLLSSASSFTKHAAVLTANIRDGFICIGRDAPESLLAAIWTSLVRFVNSTIESGSKKDRHGCEVLTLMLQALQSIVTSEAVPADKILILFEATVESIPQRVLGSASYQVGKMDVLNGTPALFLILLLLNNGMLVAHVEDKRFLQCLQTLVGCGLSGPTSPLAFGEAVLGAISRNAESLQNKEQLWMVWSAVVSPLTDTITQTNEVNQGDALEHNFSAIHSALLFPITHLLHGTPLQQTTQKSMLCTWSKLYKVFARCSALVATAEENICCEELCVKMTAAIDRTALMVPSALNAVASILQVMAECFDFSPYTVQFQQKLKSPRTPVNWMKKRNKALGNLSTFLSLLVQCLEVYLEDPEATTEATGLALVAILSVLFTNLALANTVTGALTSLTQPVTLFFKHAASEPPRFTSQLLGKLEKLLGEVLGCLQTCSALPFNSELLGLLSPLLCVLFPHKNKQFRTSVTQFWNSTFANSVSLTYPDEIGPILSLVRQKTPIILPGFEVVSVSEDLSGQYSSESSQLETRISGIPLSSAGKRDSLLGNASELKDKCATKTSKAVSTKLEFGSPKPARREILEEEASIDFVFIPPETKERVLTEHQKEVKRTKRVDIPAMYNNLDASLDTTVFTQYTQSQEDTQDNLQTDRAEGAIGADDKVPQDVENKENTNKVLTKDTPDCSSPKAEENHQQNAEVHESDGEDNDKSEDGSKDLDLLSKEGTSPNISSSSDLVSGTPQKPNSRRQSFITLEKYSGGKPSSPDIVSTFTGPLIKTNNSQERCNTNSPSLATQTLTGPNSLDSVASQTGINANQSSGNYASESPVRPKEYGPKCVPLRLTERMPSNAKEEDDVVPDTQTEVEKKKGDKTASILDEPSSQEEESSSQTLNDSQSSETKTPPGEPRRSGRYRVRPLLPGEDPKKLEKNVHPRRTRSGELLKSDSPKPSKPNTRTRQSSEEDSGKDRLRKRFQTEQVESSQTNSQGRTSKRIKLYSSSQDFLDKTEPRRRSTRESGQTESQLEMRSDDKIQSQGRSGRKSRASLLTKEEKETGKKVLQDNTEPPAQTKALEHVEKAQEDEPKRDSQITAPLPTKTDDSHEHESGELSKKDDEETKENSLTTTPKTGIQSQVLVCQYQTEEDSLIVTSSPTTEESPGKMCSTDKPVSESNIQDKPKTVESSDENMSQEDSQMNIHSSSDSQSLRRSRRSKVSPNVEESEEKKTNSSTRRSRSSSQVALPAASNAETTTGGRGRRSTQLKMQAKSSPLSTPENSQSLNSAGSAESSQGRGRYSSRRSSQPSQAKMESSESESSEPRENLLVPKKRGRKPRVSLQSPLSLESSREELTNSAVKNNSDTPQEADAQQIECNNRSYLNDSQATQDYQGSESNLDDSQTNQDFQGSELLEETQKIMPSNRESEVDNDKSTSLSVSPQMDEQRVSDSNTEDIPSKENDSRDLETAENHKTEGIADADQVETQEKASSDLSLLSDKDNPAPNVEAMAETSVEETEETSAPCESVVEKPVDCTDHQELPATDLAEVSDGTASEGIQTECSNAIDGFSKEEEQHASITEGTSLNQHTQAVDVTPQISHGSETQTVKCEGKEEIKDTNTENDVDAAPLDACTTSTLQELASKDVFQDSPLKQRDLDALMGSEIGQSPSSRTRGTWSPSASPSTSILKKGQKRPLEDQTPSPLVKSRRVSFADPIQQQETADDIDRRSPAIRTSSPRRSKNCTIPQPKYITTPTKGLMFMSPRNLHSPGHRSSKKCLISEMSQEPRPVSRDCIYPALVGCSAPVEVVLPQISSNMWPRGFGQLVRARNIKTVGDLSALTPNEIKTLPIRSPKVSTVKKALRVYEQQRKGRGGDELKSFDETEMMTSELDETCAPRNQDEKTSGETLATELPDEPVPAEGEPEKETAERSAGQQHTEGLLSETEALSCRMTPSELSQCSAQQLVQVHHRLGDMMRHVVAELQSRICQSDGKP